MVLYCIYLLPLAAHSLPPVCRPRSSWEVSERSIWRRPVGVWQYDRKSLRNAGEDGSDQQHAHLFHIRQWVGFLLGLWFWCICCMCCLDNNNNGAGYFSICVSGLNSCACPEEATPVLWDVVKAPRMREAWESRPSPTGRVSFSQVRPPQKTTISDQTRSTSVIVYWFSVVLIYFTYKLVFFFIPV